MVALVSFTQFPARVKQPKSSRSNPEYLRVTALYLSHSPSFWALAIIAFEILIALAMFVLTFALPRGGALRDAQLVQFPVTVGVWAIFCFAFREIEIGSTAVKGQNTCDGGHRRCLDGVLVFL